MSWTVDFGAWPQKWEELPEQIAVTNKETGEWDAYMLTSKAMRMIRDAKDDANWCHAELHGAELKAENERLRSCLEDAAENERLTTHEFNQLKEQRDKLRELVRKMHSELVSCEENEYICGGHKFDEDVRELGVEV